MKTISLSACIAMLFAVAMIMTGCSAKNDETVPPAEVITAAAENAGTSAVENETEAPRSAAQTGKTGIQVVEAKSNDDVVPVGTDSTSAEPAEEQKEEGSEAAKLVQQSEDQIFINRIREDIYSVPAFATVHEQDARMEKVTLMSWEELSEYYGLKIDAKTISDMIGSVLGGELTFTSINMFLPSLGRFQDGEFIFDVNSLQFIGDHQSVTISFYRDANIASPGHEGKFDRRFAPLAGEEELEVSSLNGIECIIGYPVTPEGYADEFSYESETVLGDAKMIVRTYGLSEEEAVTILKGLYALIIK